MQINYPEGKRILLAVSGGGDSCALLHATSLITRDFGIAHVDHKFRDSNDVDFVKSLSDKYSAPFFLKTLEPTSENKESYGRVERYKFFEEIRASNNFDLIATAHHRDDLVESFLMQILYGRRVYGIAEVDQKRNLIRPLLNFRKAEIYKYIEDHNLAFVEDPTNSDTDLLRNNIRHKLIPFLKENYGAHVDDAILRSLSEITDQQLITESFAKELLEGFPEFGSKEWVKLFRTKLGEIPKNLGLILVEEALLPEIGYRLGKTHRERVWDFFTGNSREVQIPAGFTLLRENSMILVTKKQL